MLANDDFSSLFVTSCVQAPLEQCQIMTAAFFYLLLLFYLLPRQLSGSESSVCFKLEFSLSDTLNIQLFIS